MDHTANPASPASRRQQGVLKLADFGLAREFVDFQMLSKLSNTVPIGGKMGKDTGICDMGIAGSNRWSYVSTYHFSGHGDIPGNIKAFFLGLI